MADVKKNENKNKKRNERANYRGSGRAFMEKCNSTSKWGDEYNSCMRFYENRIEHKGYLFGSRI